jgi:hypothetical protein
MAPPSFELLPPDKLTDHQSRDNVELVAQQQSDFSVPVVNVKQHEKMT